MARAAPDAGRDTADRLELGAMQERYPFRTILLWYAPVPGLASVGMFAGGYWFAWLFAALAVTLVLWDVLTRRNRAVYLHAGGLVYVNLLGRVRKAAAWRDVANVTGLNVRVAVSGPAFRRHDYVIVFVDGDGVDFNTVVMRDADGLATRVSQRRFDAKLARLNAGEEVAFGQFVVTPLTLTLLPPPQIYRKAPPPPPPVTVPWQRVTGARVEGGHVIVGVVGPEPALATVAELITDAELFLAVVRQRAGR
jgi:hypothetical protein